MNFRHCVCGKEIDPYFDLCETCAKKYGTKSTAWPLWLKEWMRSYKHERYMDSKFNLVMHNDDVYYESRSI